MRATEAAAAALGSPMSWGSPWICGLATKDKQLGVTSEWDFVRKQDCADVPG